jgi:hypothetical protein
MKLDALTVAVTAVMVMAAWVAVLALWTVML